MYYIVKYKGTFGFIKPWSAVRDGETFSQQFLTPSIVEGIEKKIFPEMLCEKGGIRKIVRHKLSYMGIDTQQEVTQTRGIKESRKGDKKTGYSIEYSRSRSILNRGILISPTLLLAFNNEQDAIKASKEHICLCRNEDLMLPESEIIQMNNEEFNNTEGFELIFTCANDGFLVGYNRFNNDSPMYGKIEISGNTSFG